jgi:hypothetical protein
MAAEKRYQVGEHLLTRDELRVATRILEEIEEAEMRADMDQESLDATKRLISMFGGIPVE